MSGTQRPQHDPSGPGKSLGLFLCLRLVHQTDLPGARAGPRGDRGAANDDLREIALLPVILVPINKVGFMKEVVMLPFGWQHNNNSVKISDKLNDRKIHVLVSELL